MVDIENDLNIKGSTRIQLYEFLFETNKERELFIEECRGMDSFSIRSYASKVRKEKIMNRTNKDERFIMDFPKDKSKALSQLFMEYVSPDKADSLSLDNPHEILSIHSKCSEDVYFVKFLIAVRRSR